MVFKETFILPDRFLFTKSYSIHTLSEIEPGTILYLVEENHEPDKLSRTFSKKDLRYVSYQDREDMYVVPTEEQVLARLKTLEEIGFLIK